MRLLASYLLILVVVTATGCSHFAKIPMWHPATAQVDGIKTVAVLPFEGEWGNRVSEEVSDAFSDSGTYTIVSASSLPAIRTASTSAGSPPLDQVLVAARQADIDAVLTGTIIDDELSPTDESSPSVRSRAKDKAHRSMTVEYRLIDTRTGETLSQNRISCLAEQSKSRDEKLEQTLIQRCGNEVVSQLTPQRSDCSIALANCRWMNRGSYHVRKGVRAAEQGNWDEATTAWNAARESNPKNDAAIFNLALAAASRGEFDAAEELALEAIRMTHCACYEKGLEKIRFQRSQYETAAQQRGPMKLSSIE